LLQQQQQQQQQQPLSQQKQYQLPLLQLALAGSIATFLGDVIMHPVDCIKTVMQQQLPLAMDGGGATTGSALLVTVQYMYQQSGLVAFYHGFMTYAVSDAVAAAVKFAVWELWKQQQLLLRLVPTTTTTTTTTAASKDSQHDQQQQQQQSWPMLFLGAGLAFCASSIFLVPGELIKQHLQVEHYASASEAVRDIWTRGGMMGLYAGFNGVFYRDLPYTMLELGMYEVISKSSLFFVPTVASSSSNNDVEVNVATSPPRPLDQHEPTDAITTTTSFSWRNIGAAATTGGVAAFLTTPMDVIKTKLMLESADWADGTFWDCMTTTVQMHGWPALLCGVEARVAWIVPFVCIYLPLYDTLKEQLLVRRQRTNESYDEPLVQVQRLVDNGTDDRSSLPVGS
jgi:quinol monooxygenase YgiN